MGARCQLDFGGLRKKGGVGLDKVERNKGRQGGFGAPRSAWKSEVSRPAHRTGVPRSSRGRGEERRTNA